MTSGDRLLAALSVAALACGSGGGSTTTTTRGTPSTTTTPTSAADPIAISVNGAGCSASYVNKPCVSITVCTPGTSTCQTVGDILLDTGSFGLRVFADALTVPLTQVAAGTGDLAECMFYGDGSVQWGPVKKADVVLGGASAVTVPIQVIDAGFRTAPSSCAGAEASPSAAGFNGILGIGVFAHDCGTACTTYANAGYYFRCTSAGCAGTTVPLASQVQNPVSLLPSRNNGVTITLPAVPLGGAPSAAGTLVLGVDDSATPGTVLALDGYGEFKTAFGGASYDAFVDTGSNGLFFTPPAGKPIAQCTSAAPWFCPGATLSLSASMSDPSGTSATVPFEIGDFMTLYSRTSNDVFSEIGAAGSTGYFDWGLPFFFGRTVYVGLEGTTSKLGTGPYVAY